LGPLLALIAYLAVVNWQYPGGWIKAAGIALFAAVASLVVLYLTLRRESRRLRRA